VIVPPVVISETLFVYYGAADTFIGVATAKISELVPADVRERIRER